MNIKMIHLAFASRPSQDGFWRYSIDLQCLKYVPGSIFRVWRKANKELLWSAAEEKKYPRQYLGHFSLLQVMLRGCSVRQTQVVKWKLELEKNKPLAVRLSNSLNSHFLWD